MDTESYRSPVEHLAQVHGMHRARLAYAAGEYRTAAAYLECIGFEQAQARRLVALRFSVDRRTQ